MSIEVVDDAFLNYGDFNFLVNLIHERESKVLEYFDKCYFVMHLSHDQKSLSDVRCLLWLVVLW